MIDKLRKDSFWIGLSIGFLIPLHIFFLLKFMVWFLPAQIQEANIFTLQRLILISVLANIFLLRYYLLKLKYDLAGRGILAATFVIALIFAIIEFSN